MKSLMSIMNKPWFELLEMKKKNFNQKKKVREIFKKRNYVKIYQQMQRESTTSCIYHA